MKRILLTLGALFMGIALTPIVADPAPTASYDRVSLPPGPILARVPDYAAWRIDYSYTNPESGQGAAPSSSSANDPAKLRDAHLPKTFTMTQTKPLWHAVQVDASGLKKETWYDGMMRYEQGADPSRYIPVLNNPGENTSIYFSNGKDFPDVEWVSAGTYLGQQKGTTYWVFQQSAEGAMLWVDSTNHRPVRWTKGRETRTFQFLPEPTEPLTLAPQVAALSRAFKELDRQARVTPPGI